MTDRELLYAAANAAGLEIVGVPLDGDPASLCVARGYQVVKWNPLTDDGDALRLAAKLRMLVDTDATEVNGIHQEPVSPHGDEDRLRATRRAIVRAAAAAGGDS